jgi:hypothetical protein
MLHYLVKHVLDINTMIKIAKIRLESPLLGDKEDGTGVKRFERTTDSSTMYLNNDVFRWALEEAICLMRLDHLVDPDFIVEILPIRRPTFVLYNRKYTDKISGQKKSVSHEAIRGGSVLTLELLVLNKLPKTKKINGLRPPTDDELKVILTCIGKFFGLSPWGSYTGKYGRFELLNLEEKEEKLCLGTEEKETHTEK